MSAENNQRLAPNRTMQRVPENARWLDAAELDPAQREAWKQAGQVSSVVHEGKELFPGYQFIRVDGYWQPRLSIRLILEALGPVDHPWYLAAGFLGPHSWLVETDGDSTQNLSPQRALARGLDDQVIRAASRRLGGDAA